MTTYPIGTLADQIIALSIKLDGRVKPVVLNRSLHGKMVDVPGHDYGEIRVEQPFDFHVEVDGDHHGVVEIAPPKRQIVHARAVIPLGLRRPFFQSEMPPYPGADGAFSFSECVKFRLEGNQLQWRTENMSGRTVLNELYPEVAVVLRLPAGNRGAIASSSPLATDANGRLLRRVAVT